MQTGVLRARLNENDPRQDSSTLINVVMKRAESTCELSLSACQLANTRENLNRSTESPRVLPRAHESQRASPRVDKNDN